MKNWNRPLAILFAVTLLGVSPTTVPGSEFAGVDLSLTALIADVTDPYVIGAVLAIALVCGWRGALGGLRALCGTAPSTDAAHRNGAARALAGAARGALYGAFLLNAVALVSCYWPDPPHESVGWLSVSRMRFVQYGALLPVLLPALVLLPVAESLGSARTWHALDLGAIVGLWLCSIVVVLSVFVWKAPLIGTDTPTETWLPPTFGTLDAAFIAWALVGFVAFAAVAWLARGQVSLDTRTLLASGVVLSGIVQLAGMNAIASTGAQGEPGQLQALAGRMLLPPILALGTALAVRWRSPRAASLPAPAAS